MKPMATLIGACALVLAGCGGNTQEGGKGPGSGGSGGSGGSAASGGGSASGGTSAAAGTAGTGGTAAAGGSSAAGGSGGSAGSAACSQGQPCSPEGASCSEPGCCPCSYTCRNGSWDISVCPACLAPGCPDQAPADGEACDECLHPVDDPCEYSSSDGSQLSAVCDGTTWSVTTTGTQCLVGNDCPTGQVCFYGGGLTPYPGGTCQLDPCAGQALSCDCAATLCFGGPCVSAANREVHCECYTC